MNIIRGLIGIITLLLFSWIISENRKAIKLKPVISGILLQILLVVLMLKVQIFKDIFLFLNKAVAVLEKSTQAGTSLVFGYIGGGKVPFEEIIPGGSYVLAFQSLPMVLIVSALSSLLFYWRILPYVVRGFSYTLQKTMGVGGAVGLSTSANIFLGMVESPLFVKPYLRQMSRGELFAVMSTGMAGIAGTVMILYASILGSVIPDVLGQILLASVVSAIASLVFSFIMVPPVGEPTSGDITVPQTARSSLDAVVKGTEEGIGLLINIVATLVVFVALVHLANYGLSMLGVFYGGPLTLQRVLGLIMSPFVWAIGIPWSEAQVAGSLMGTKTVLNEFVAYIDMSKLPPGTLCQRSNMIMLYTLCGFANLGSLGILIAGLSSMVPEKKDEIISLGFKSIISGTLSSSMTGAIIGMFY
ncbi:NupC/NupG family nucleoside CNT transporter [Candidatus Magnetomonas plexicatena]|uniref:NupC/NupG family nucleoside CNT transporter n=1 Tax=Candidatus Magnetomonas plexicatena TaxID=2552947 RepID=UPI0010FFF658|nr:nucleoside:proton symporter [Nitrospirales bacterium LBB_01]